MKRSDDQKKGWPPTLHVLWAIPAAAAFAAMAATTPAPVTALRQVPSSDTVRIQATCVGQGRLGRVSVDPWTMVVPTPTDLESTEIVWILDNTQVGGTVQDADSIAIQPKNDREWPFGDTRIPSRGRGPAQAARAKMFNVIPARGGRGNPGRVTDDSKFRYNVIVFCTDGNSTYTVAIDPDIDTGGGF